MKQKFHYIYKTVNLKNNKFYIGKHSTDKIDDGYLGSGKHLKSSIKKYGKESFSREILSFFNSEKELDDAEREFITEDLIQNPLCYNLATGGEGGMRLKNISAKDLSLKAAATLKANPEKLKARNEKIGIKQKAFAAAHPEIVAKRIADMNKTCKGTTKENNPNIQKQIEARQKSHEEKMRPMMDRLSAGEFNGQTFKFIASALNTSTCSVRRMKRKLERGQRTWYPL